jgi:hypothetical protein
MIMIHRLAKALNLVRDLQAMVGGNSHNTSRVDGFAG